MKRTARYGFRKEKSMLSRRISNRTIKTLTLERLTRDDNVEETEELNNDKTRTRTQRRTNRMGRTFWSTKRKIK